MDPSVLLILVVIYLVGTLLIGAWAGSKVKNTADFAVAGHSLPLYMVITTSFATWFGAETVMGIPARFAEGGLRETIEDPFGASFCLILVGLFFAKKLYNMKLLTIGDFYRQRYGVQVEIISSVIIIISYLGWVAAQITALGLVFNVLSQDYISTEVGMVIGTVLVLVYVMMGGMLAVAYTDFIQMIVLVIGLSYIAWIAADMAGGTDKVVALANEKEWLRFFPENTTHGWLFFIGAGITMMLGSIPQQDVFQRVMSADSANSARTGAVVGGVLYLIFAFVPMFIVASALIIMPEKTAALLEDDYQKVLPTLILSHMPDLAKVLFFGALVSAIKSCSSATLLAPSTSFVENILRNLYPNMKDKQVLLAMRMSILTFTIAVLAYSMAVHGTSIYEMVSSAYQVTLAGAFIPLVFGLYWKRATTQGALLAMALGISVWLTFFVTDDWGGTFPSQLAGVGASIVGMLVGSLGPQIIKHTTAPPKQVDESTLDHHAPAGN